MPPAATSPAGPPSAGRDPRRIPVAILGATGMVGQRFVQLLEAHPWFDVVELSASERSVGRRYGDASTWRLPGRNPMSDATLLAATPEAVRAPLVFSALDKSVAQELEPAFAAAGRVVVSNASAFRMTAGVPLIIPEVNPDHIEWVRAARRAGRGFILTNPNCTCIPMTMALAPLHRTFGVEAATCASYQAVSGAGYPGESAWDMLGNVHPHPGDEEHKVAEEPRKILASGEGAERGELAAFPISARCVRVPVLDGHLVAVHVRLRERPSIDEVKRVLSAFRGPVVLPSLPERPIVVTDARDRPTPRGDAGAGGGMTVTVGRVEECEVMGLKFFALAHNVIRGAAGAAIANAELVVERGLV
ncbi:MAG: aspartate-semialdehyde dehydrogenase [Myxococcales bacterium]|nr:aspartate-semialdehyde dehydrogenase [Myxococcales bacterium]